MRRLCIARTKLSLVRILREKGLEKGTSWQERD